MTNEATHPGSRHFRAVTVPDLSTLSDAVNATYDRIDDVADLALAHYRQTAPPVGGVPQPVTADGTVLPPRIPDAGWVRRAALVAAEGLTFTASGTASFDAEHTAFLADLGRDLRKDGITVEHHTAAAEALGRALCEIYRQPYPGVDLTYQAAEDAGLPAGLTELLQTVDLGVRITALGAVEDDDEGIPAAADAEVLEIQPRSPRVTVVRLSATPAQTGWSGQFLEVRSPGDPDHWRSVASSIPPNTEGFLEFALFHPVDRPPAVTVGEHWVVANPTGALELPDTPGADATPVTLVALGAGLAPLRALLLDASTRDAVPPVHLYWQVDHRDDLHEYAGLAGLAGIFGWLTVTPVVTAGEVADALADDAWYGLPERERFRSYSQPGPDQLAHCAPLRHGTTAAQAAVDDAADAGTDLGGRRVLVAGDPGDAGDGAGATGVTGVRAAVQLLLDAGADPDLLTAEPA